MRGIAALWFGLPPDAARRRAGLRHAAVLVAAKEVL